MSSIQQQFSERIPAPRPPSIPPEQWRVLRMHINDGLSTVQIAVQLNTNYGTVSMRLNTAAARYQTIRAKGQVSA